MSIRSQENEQGIIDKTEAIRNSILFHKTSIGKHRFKQPSTPLEVQQQCPNCNREALSLRIFSQQRELWKNEPCIISGAVCECGDVSLVRLNPRIEKPVMLFLLRNGLNVNACLSIKRTLFFPKKNPHLEIWDLGVKHACLCPHGILECVCLPEMTLESISIPKEFMSVFEKKLQYCKEADGLLSEDDVSRIITLLFQLKKV